MKYEKIDYVIKNKWKTSCYSKLNKDCRSIVDDLVDSSKFSLHWSEDKKQLYFTKAIITAYELGRYKKENNFISKLISIRDRFLIFIFKFIYVP